MNIICQKNELIKCINIVSKAVPNRSAMPILECILIDATTDKIKMTGNDMEIGIETVLEGEIIEKGIIALEAKLFSDIIRKLPDAEVIIESDEINQTKILCENVLFSISGKNGEEFSLLPQVQKEKSITLSQFALKDIINQTIFCTTDSDTQKMMSAELFEVKDNILRVIALDGHRIAIRNIELKEDYGNVKVVVPAKTLSEVSKIIEGDADKEVNIYFDNRFILFEFNETKVITRLVEGEYFNVDRMISSEYETRFTINKRNFQDCNDRASLMIKEGDKKPIIMTIEENKLKINIHTTIGSMNEEFDINKSGKDLIIGFNPKFIVDALRAIDDEDVDVYLINSKAPCFIRDKDNRYIYLILPVNFNTAG